jgi:hypothetical protein
MDAIFWFRCEGSGAVASLSTGRPTEVKIVAPPETGGQQISGSGAANRGPAPCSPIRRSLQLNRYPKATNPAPPLLLAALVAALLSGASPASGQTPRDGQELLRNGIENLRTFRDRELPHMTDVAAAIRAQRELFDTRRLAQRVVALDFALDDLAGVLIVDAYDEEYLAVVDTLVGVFTTHDRDLPPAEAGEELRRLVGELPTITGTPAPYVVTFVIGRTLAGVAKIPSDADPELRANVEEIAVRVIGALARRYRAARVTESQKRAADDEWHESVVERLRCPQHRAGYSIREMRNGLKPDGSLYRRYVLTCTGGQEDRQVDFDLGALGVMSQSKGRQALRKPLESPGARRPGVTP